MQDMKPKMPRVPVRCLIGCLVTGVALLAATTCPHVSWFGQFICGAMGTFLVLATVAGFLGLRATAHLVRITRALLRGVLGGGRRPGTERPDIDRVHRPVSPEAPEDLQA